MIGAIWDMDGVLVDTGEFHFDSWMLALGEAGIPFDRDFFRRTFGMTSAGIVEILLDRKPEADELARIVDRKEDSFRQAVRGQVQPLPGVRTLLERNRQRGLRQAVASSAPWENIDLLLEEMGIRQYFDALVSGADLPGKPDPAVFLEAAGKIDVPPDRCVVFEDAIAGVAGAKAAGMKCVAVLTTNPASALQKADLIVERLDQLEDGWLEKLFPEAGGGRGTRINTEGVGFSN